ncbi:MAG: siphovirus Gp157 family protein [Streptosporangiaceae bacterium]|nr:siphovirus Gp157 family protein [Streptosporangiaceae bacterium]
MSAPALALVPRVSFADHIAEVEHIVSLVDLLDRADELTPERYEELQHDLIGAIAGTRAKVDDTARVLAFFEAQAAAAKAEEQRLKARREYFERQKDRLEGYVLAALTASRLRKIDGNVSTLAARLNPPSVLIEEGAQLPEAFLRTPPPPAPQPDKTAIKDALKAGEAVPGCRLVQTERLVRT